MSIHYTLPDRLCLGLDQIVRTLTNAPSSKGIPSPAKHSDENKLTPSEQKHSAALMRVNHAGEICAQALYQGQALVTKSKDMTLHMQQAALEEGDHLNWCNERILQLNSHTSYLNPLWYSGSFCIGLLAGMSGDRYSLGFVAETEKQVIKHLEKHLALLPATDEKSRKILTQMAADEKKHQNEAIAYGAITLPPLMQSFMTMTAKIMVNTAYYF